ncbi:MAG TPA: outer membrane beta-barrel protein [Vicinamibacterales bacterium]|nr:outer membrane beta-barrel protein [Vicinamibacterales bacterium]
MRTFGMAITVIALTTTTAAPLFAQERGQNGGWQDASAYVTGLGGFQAATGSTTGDLLIEGGVRVAPHVMVFGDLGWFRNLQADLTSNLNNTVATLQNTEGLGVTASGTLPALYSIGGVRVEIPASNLFLPYVFGGAGVAHLSPTQQFNFASGTMPDGSNPTVGQDVTSNLTTSGLFAPTMASTAFMYTIGGGVLIPVAQRWVVDAAYRYSRIAADNTLSASPLSTNGMTFGLGYRF